MNVEEAIQHALKTTFLDGPSEDVRFRIKNKIHDVSTINARGNITRRGLPALVACAAFLAVSMGIIQEVYQTSSHTPSSGSEISTPNSMLRNVSTSDLMNLRQSTQKLGYEISLPSYMPFTVTGLDTQVMIMGQTRTLLTTFFGSATQSVSLQIGKAVVKPNPEDIIKVVMVGESQAEYTLNQNEHSLFWSNKGISYILTSQYAQPGSNTRLLSLKELQKIADSVH